MLISIGNSTGFFEWIAGSSVFVKDLDVRRGLAVFVNPPVPPI